MTRFSTKVHNNLISESAVMGDVKDLKSELSAFMQSMTIRQQTLEGQMGESLEQLRGNNSETENKESSRLEVQSMAEEPCMPLGELATLNNKSHWRSICCSSNPW